MCGRIDGTYILRSIATRWKRIDCATSTSSGLTLRVPCHVLVMISGMAVISTTKMVAMSDSPNHSSANMAQIADETVLGTGIRGPNELPTARVAPYRLHRQGGG